MSRPRLDWSEVEKVLVFDGHTTIEKMEEDGWFTAMSYMKKFDLSYDCAFLRCSKAARLGTLEKVSKLVPVPWTRGGTRTKMSRMTFYRVVKGEPCKSKSTPKVLTKTKNGSEKIAPYHSRSAIWKNSKSSPCS